jgi:hypothetical protein
MNIPELVFLRGTSWMIIDETRQPEPGDAIRELGLKI